MITKENHLNSFEKHTHTFFAVVKVVKCVQQLRFSFTMARNRIKNFKSNEVVNTVITDKHINKISHGKDNGNPLQRKSVLKELKPPYWHAVFTSL